MQGSGDAAGDGIEFDADIVVFLLFIEIHEVADAAARFQDRGPFGHTQMGNGVVDGLHDDGRRVEGVERRPLVRCRTPLARAAIPTRFRVLSSRRPCSGRHRIGKDATARRAETGELGKRLPFLGRGCPPLLFDLL